ncbi:NAD(P)H-binding protein [Pedobacter insulae]|uniref:Nucleoside-diphosphate-sugar epimerase n=1 Tax=Pedobacter insulae TaxID=414048 RepID=A0A1I2YUN9_9SPHI|nr:NAD(P)H-binding protein [Pedobacter insulae]SFH28826.1 Nucleoside-diphosphate-sugar epimerase [Pedobacter insulae]
MKKETISILGCGWYGVALAEALLAEGYIVKGSTTNAHKISQLADLGIVSFLLNLADKNEQFNTGFFRCDVLIICIPPRRNNAEAAVDYVSQIRNIGTIATTERVKNIILISSSGVYEDGNFIVNETNNPTPTSETGKSLLAAETFLRNHPDFVSTIIRFGGLIGPNRNLARHFAGKTGIANGLAPINLIHLTDCIGLTSTILNTKKFGVVYHAVCPDHPTRKDFYTKLCIESGFEPPEFINELQNWKQIESVNIPAVLSYEWKIRFMQSQA